MEDTVVAEPRPKSRSSKGKEADLGLEPLVPEPFLDALANAIAGAWLSIQAFIKACQSPTVLKTLARVSKTIIITAVVQYLLLMVTLWPINLMLRVVRIFFKKTAILGVTSSAASCMFIYPLVTMRLIRYAYRKQLETCFFDTLQQLDPGYAAELAGRDKMQKPGVAAKIQDKLLGAITEVEDDFKTVMLLTLAAPLLRMCRDIPYIGFLAAAAAEFITIGFTVGRPYAAAAMTLVFALAPRSEGAIMSLVGLWAGAKSLGASSLKHFMYRSIPEDKRGAFIKTFEYTIVSYFMLPTYLMRWPVVGALAAFPAAAMAAYSLRDIMSRPGVKSAMERLEKREDVEKAS